MFQSTLPRRERQTGTKKKRKKHRVSIHAPAKGATGAATSRGMSASGVSIHAPAKGATVCALSSIAAPRVSIHAPAKGATTFSATISLASSRVSIHAPAKGATYIPLEQMIYTDVSIHAPAKGATKQAVKKSYHDLCFNPRSREGSDLLKYKNVLEQLKFQSTLPRRERHAQQILYIL